MIENVLLKLLKIYNLKGLNYKYNPNFNINVNKLIVNLLLINHSASFLQ